MDKRNHARREFLGKIFATLSLGVALMGLVLYYSSHSRIVLAVVAVGAVGVIAFSLWSLMERGQRLTDLRSALIVAGAAQQDGRNPKEILIADEGQTVSARIWEDNGFWHLQREEEMFEHKLAEPSGTVMMDIELGQFAKRLAQERGYTLHCCGTCAYFAYSSSSKELSRGWVGYCLRHAAGPLNPEHDSVHLWHICPDWETGQQHQA